MLLYGYDWRWSDVARSVIEATKNGMEEIVGLSPTRFTNTLQFPLLVFSSTSAAPDL
jgi:hypothetical protein